MSFADKLIQLRKAKGLSQEDLADSLGVSRQAISRWEQGNTFPDLLNLQKIMKVFGVSADYLICDEYAAEGVTLGNKQNYHGYAIFENAGYTYYLSTHSDDPDFFDETLKNKLIYGATHDPNADNSEHAITGPGKPLDSNE